MEAAGEPPAWREGPRQRRDGTGRGGRALGREEEVREAQRAGLQSSNGAACPCCSQSSVTSTSGHTLVPRALWVISALSSARLEISQQGDSRIFCTYGVNRGVAILRHVSFPDPSVKERWVVQTGGSQVSSKKLKKQCLQPCHKKQASDKFFRSYKVLEV